MAVAKTSWIRVLVKRAWEMESWFHPQGLSNLPRRVMAYKVGAHDGSDPKKVIYLSQRYIYDG